MAECIDGDERHQHHDRSDDVPCWMMGVLKGNTSGLVADYGQHIHESQTEH